MNSKYISILIGVVLVLGVAYLVYSNSNEVAEEPENQQKEIEISENDLPQEVGEPITKDGYTITKELIDPNSTETPSIATPLFTSIPQRPKSVSLEEYTSIQSKMKEVITMLGENTGNTDAWLDLALYHNMLGSSKKAEEIWVYLNTLSPGMIQPVANLAQLYLTQGDQKKAETYFQKAIVNEPKMTQLYSDLHDIYVSQGRTNDAISILKKGIDADVKAHHLSVILARYYVLLGRTSGAKTEYDRALQRATASGNTAIAESIKSEKETVK
jgi:tetratricopeptide (TPR) repeat protein